MVYHCVLCNCDMKSVGSHLISQNHWKMFDMKAKEMFSHNEKFRYLYDLDIELSEKKYNHSIVEKDVYDDSYKKTHQELMDAYQKIADFTKGMVPYCDEFVELNSNVDKSFAKYILHTMSNRLYYKLPKDDFYRKDCIKQANKHTIVKK